MHFPVSNRALLHGMMGSALVLAGSTACSRSDHMESGSDNSPAVAQDTVAPGQTSASSSTTAATSTGSDTTTAGPTTNRGPAAGATTPPRVPSNAPRAATASPPAERQDTSLQGDSAVAGYLAMERDTASLPESDSARVTRDTSETSQNAGYVEMARDTSTAVDQIDTTGVAASADGAIQARVDTSHIDAEVTADADVSADSGIAAGAADTTGNAERIHPTEDSTEILGVESERVRPPEDSTEILGNVTSSETADEEPINENEQVIGAEDRETVATSESRTDDFGAAAIGGTVTGAEAVGLMTRQGVRCSIVDPESNEEVRWDMSSTPVSLNPCGLGSMNLSKVVGQQGSGAEGQ